MYNCFYANWKTFDAVARSDSMESADFLKVWNMSVAFGTPCSDIGRNHAALQKKSTKFLVVLDGVREEYCLLYVASVFRTVRQRITEERTRSSSLRCGWL